MSKNKNNTPKHCSNCKYWECYNEKNFEKFGECTEGECHRYPPSTINFERVNEMGIMVPETIMNTPLLSHPFTFASEWCGEFKPMKNPRWIDNGE